MSNLVEFDAKFKFVNLKSGLNLGAELSKTPTPQWTERMGCHHALWHLAICELDRQFIDRVVSTVKQTHFTTRQATCSISLESLASFPVDSCPSPSTQHLTIIAKILYHSYGIKIQQVDDMKSPQTMVVAWPCDNRLFHPASPTLIQWRKEGFRTDCTLKFGEKLYPVHGTVLAAKSLYFEKMFKSNCKEAKLGAIIPIIMEAVEEKSVEMLIDYFYTGELDPKDVTTTRIDNLVNFSSYFDLPYLQQLCFEQLCKSVNAGNLKEYMALARHYNHKELESALAQYIENEVTPDNFAELIQLGKSENIEDLEAYCTAGLTEQIKKIDYEACGSEKSTQLKYFEKILDAIIINPRDQRVTQAA